MDAPTSDDPVRNLQRRWLDLLPAAVFACDLSGELRAFNARAAALWGREPVSGECSMAGSRAVLLGVDGAQGVSSGSPVAVSLESGDPQREKEAVLECADGSRVPVLVSVDLLRDSRGAPAGAIAIVVEITERKHAERRGLVQLAITRALAEARSIAEAAPRLLGETAEILEWDLGALWLADDAARMLRCADVWDRPGANLGELALACRGLVFAPGAGLPGTIWQNARPMWIADLARDGNFPRLALAARLGLASGFGFPIVWGGEALGVMELFRRRPTEIDDELLKAFAGIGAQVGQFIERVRAEDRLRAREHALRESEARFAGFMQHLVGLAWIKDAEGRYVYVNDAAAQTFQAPASRIIGCTDLDLFPAETAHAFRENDRRALKSGKGISVIETLTHSDGTVHHSIVSKFPIPGANGGLPLIGGMAIDVTDRMRAEQALREADRLKDQFLAMLAHELRNPLAPIRNCLHILRYESAGEEDRRMARETAERQVAHMARLLDDLLDVARIRHGKIELRRERVDLGLAALRAVEAVRPIIEEKEHRLDIALPGEPTEIEADPTRIEQVAINLLQNAAKYTDRRGGIRVAVERQGSLAILRVRDSGIGIPREMLDRIFDLFVQVDRGSERSQGGVGIGLTLVRTLVELHSGSVEAVSEGAGRGTEVIVRLPALDPPAQRSAGAHAAAESSTPAAVGSPRRVLVVDDNVDSADSLALVLRLLGIEVRAAYDGSSALAIAAEFRPHAALLDLGMAGMDGLTLARRLRERPELAPILLVAVTGWGQAADRRQSREAGFDEHFVKPVDPAQLLKVLSGVGER